MKIMCRRKGSQFRRKRNARPPLKKAPRNAYGISEHREPIYLYLDVKDLLMMYHKFPMNMTKHQFGDMNNGFRDLFLPW